MQKQSTAMEQVYLSLCEQVDTPKSLGAWLRYKYQRELVPEMKFNPRDYTEKSIVAARGDYLVQSFCKKYKSLAIDVDTASVALSGFASSEARNQETNRRLKRCAEAQVGLIASVMFTAQQKIARLLGPFSVFCVEPFFDWGPGATFDLPRRMAHPDLKMIATPMTVSRGAASLLHNVISRDLHWSYALLGHFPSGDWSVLPSAFRFVDCCRVVTVPKDATKDRTIAIEATGNLFLQKGFGGYYRKRLRSVGIDLDDQSANQRAAEAAYHGGLATLDLKDASNSVCIELVYQLFPYEWASAMDAVRSRSALMPDGTTRRLEMFSSMGNGFTFELETLIFWALSSALLDVLGLQGRVWVYGDDIIVPSAAASSLVSVLNHCGFAINEAKSFLDGLFFESCGKHYFCGEDITPVYQKEALQGEEFIRCHNRLFRWAERNGCHLKATKLIRQNLSPPALRGCRIPASSQGDDGFLTDWSGGFDAFMGTDRNKGIQCRVLRHGTRSLPGDGPALYARNLRKVRHPCWDPNPMDAWSQPCAVGDGSPTYGMIELPDSSPGSGYSFGSRWIFPPGVCIC